MGGRSVSPGLIKNPAAFFHDVAQLHDAEVRGIKLSAAGLVIWLDDLYSGIADDTEYTGPVPAALRFAELEAVQLSIDPVQQKLAIYGVDIMVVATDHCYGLTFHFAPGGRLAVRCRSIHLVIDGDL